MRDKAFPFTLSYEGNGREEKRWEERREERKEGCDDVR